MDYKHNYEAWLDAKNLDDTLRKELVALSNDEIIERFSTPLKFGTGGLRGPMGVGISRLNVHTIMQAAAGFASYLKKHYQEGVVVISYDNRKDSQRFAEKSALVLASYGLQAKVSSQKIR